MADQNIWMDKGTLQLAVSVAVALFVVLVVVFLLRLWNRMFGHGSGYPVRREVEQNREIYNGLVELRALTDADRVYVFRFHNGVEFLPSHPAWKISCTHEVVKPGVTYESAKLQGLLVSLIPNIIGPVLTGCSSAAGITVKECPDCPFRNKCVRENKRVVILQVNDMESSFCKFHLESQNIQTAILCGIARDGNVYGLVGVDFCGVSLGPARVLDIAQRVCRATEKIQFLLQYKKAPVDLPIPSHPITARNGD